MLGLRFGSRSSGNSPDEGGRLLPREGTPISRLTLILAGLQREGRHRTVRLGAAIAAALLLALTAGLALPDHDGITRASAGLGHAATSGAAAVTVTHLAAHADSRQLPRAVVTISPNATATNIPTSFLGLSTEYWALPLFDRNMPVFERVLSLIHVPGTGPLVLRVGGDSADHSFWDPKIKKMPSWAFQLTPTWLSRLSTLVRHDHVRLIIDLNLVTDTPLTAAAWAHAAETWLPHGSVVGFEIGNEPDLYQRSYWLAAIARSPLQSTSLPRELTPSLYVEDFDAYAAALAQNAPGVPLLGPALAHPMINKGWISSLIRAERPTLAVVSGHMYPYSACAKPNSRSYPTVARLLSERATAGMAAAVSPAVALAHEAGLPFRLTELNSVTCGGRNGVSNSFATALWAPDALFELVKAGVNGVNLHVRADAINAPFSLNRHGLYARPLLYGLLMFDRMFGPHTQLVHLQLRATPSLHLKAWATRVRGGILHVLLIDKGDRSINVDLHLPATGSATVQRLLAPSASARSGETLDGQTIGPEGNWIGTRRTELIARSATGYHLIVPRQSEALVGVRMVPSPPAGPHASLGRQAQGRAAVSFTKPRGAPACARTGSCAAAPRRAHQPRRR